MLKGAAAILMEVETGRIISLASLPDFDPNHRPSLPSRGSQAESPLLIKLFKGFMTLVPLLKFLLLRKH